MTNEPFCVTAHGRQLCAEAAQSRQSALGPIETSLPRRRRRQLAQSNPAAPRSQPSSRLLRHQPQLLHHRLAHQELLWLAGHRQFGAEAETPSQATGCSSLSASRLKNPSSPLTISRTTVSNCQPGSKFSWYKYKKYICKKYHDVDRARQECCSFSTKTHVAYEQR